MKNRSGLFLALCVMIATSACNKDASANKTVSEKSIVPKTQKVSKEKNDFFPIPDSCPKEHYVYLSWNLANFGKSKSPETLELMAEIGRDADIIAGQEINAGSRGVLGDGPQTVAKLTDLLERKGSDWDYIISDRTQSEGDNAGVERYAYWMKSPIWMNRREAVLVKSLEQPIDREPYSAVFHIGNNTVTTYSIHAVPTAKDPVQEVQALAKSEELQRSGNMILSGDFNLAGKDMNPILNPTGFTPHIAAKTSLKQKVGKKGEHLLYQYDNIYTKGNIGVCASGVVDFPASYFAPVTDESLHEARKLSDHLPVYIVFYFKK